MKRTYIAPYSETTVLQPAAFMNLSGGNQPEDPINSTKGNSLGDEEETTEWEHWDADDGSSQLFSYDR